MDTDIGRIVPYCGVPPLPADIMAAWNLDPWVIALLLSASVGVPVLWKGGEHRRAGFYGAGLLVLALAFLSPICALSSALFSARVVHHLLLIVVAAPLLAAAVPASGRAAPRLLPLLVLTHVVAVWFWHAPAPYVAALSSDTIYWVMEATLLGTAVLVWRELLASRADLLRTGLSHVVLIALMGLLGALITFAPEPLYAPHVLTTEPFGLTALEDQQLAGLIMWVPAIVPNLLAALLCFGRLLGSAASETVRSA